MTGTKQMCLESIDENVETLTSYLAENIKTKGNSPQIPETGMAVLQQQFILIQAIETWIASLKK